MSRYASIWFPFLLAEYAARKNPVLREVPFVFASPQRGRMVIDSVNLLAMDKGIRPGMVLADCKAIMPGLEMVKTEPGRNKKLLHALAGWCIRYTPFVAVDLPDGLIFDTTGCTHLWGSEIAYLENIKTKLAVYGYTVRTAIADTIGAAWAVAHFGHSPVVKSGGQFAALRDLPPAALRLDPSVLVRLEKLGLRRIDSFIGMPRHALRRRFGQALPSRIDQVLGHKIELAVPVKPVEPYQERLCSIEPIASATGISIALRQLLQALCVRFENESLGLRQAVFKAYRVDGDVQQIEIGTGHSSRNPAHLFKLFEHKISTLEPALGFELFVLEAPKVEAVTQEQAVIWNASTQDDLKVAELLDRVAARTGPDSVSRYLPAEHYWPERSVKKAEPLWEKPVSGWRSGSPRPIHLLACPESVEVTAVVPDYPPLFFRYKNKLYSVVKSDGPERIEQEWWLADGFYRDYYCVEDENGARYWLFRLGPYDKEQPKWFIHGFFA